MALSPSQQSLLARAFLSRCEWYPHGQSGQAAKALARAGLVVLRESSYVTHGSEGEAFIAPIYTAPAIKLTEAGVQAVKRVREHVIDEAIRILEVQGE